jgi:hypothetical protein
VRSSNYCKIRLEENGKEGSFVALAGSLTLSSFVLKRRPKAYKAKDAAYPVGGNAGFYLASYPRPYPKTPQQKKIAEAARACGIKAGISKSELMKQMKECIPTKF